MQSPSTSSEQSGSVPALMGSAGARTVFHSDYLTTALGYSSKDLGSTEEGLSAALFGEGRVQEVADAHETASSPAAGAHAQETAPGLSQEVGGAGSAPGTSEGLGAASPLIAEGVSAQPKGPSLGRVTDLWGEEVLLRGHRKDGTQAWIKQRRCRQGSRTVSLATSQNPIKGSDEAVMRQ